LGVIKIK